MGGFIAAELAIQFPARVERLVLVQRRRACRSSSSATSTSCAPCGASSGALTAWARLARVAARTRSPGAARTRRRCCAIVAAHPELLPAPLTPSSCAAAARPGFVDALDALTDYPIRERLPEIACPTLIVWGEDDRLVPVRDAFEFERLIPNARKVIYRTPGTSRCSSGPRAFNALLEGFLHEGAGEGGDRPGRDVPGPSCRARGAGAGGGSRRLAPDGLGRAASGADRYAVIAPSAALPTSLAYFASTPVRSEGSSGVHSATRRAISSSSRSTSRRRRSTSIVT